MCHPPLMMTLWTWWWWAMSAEHGHCNSLWTCSPTCEIIIIWWTTCTLVLIDRPHLDRRSSGSWGLLETIDKCVRFRMHHEAEKEHDNINPLADSWGDWTSCRNRIEQTWAVETAIQIHHNVVLAGGQDQGPVGGWFKCLDINVWVGCPQHARYRQQFGADWISWGKHHGMHPSVSRYVFVQFLLSWMSLHLEIFDKATQSQPNFC